MKKEVVIVIAEDDDGHATLIRKNLERAGILNEIIRFKDGLETLDFFLEGEGQTHRKADIPYLLLLDIRMPRVNGFEVLRKLKADENYARMPVIMITTTDDPKEVQKCHEMGCSNYIAKPIEYEMFVNAIRQLGLFLLVVEVPNLNKDEVNEK